MSILETMKALLSLKPKYNECWDDTISGALDGHEKGRRVFEPVSKGVHSVGYMNVCTDAESPQVGCMLVNAEVKCSEETTKRLVEAIPSLPVYLAARSETKDTHTVT